MATSPRCPPKFGHDWRAPSRKQRNLRPPAAHARTLLPAAALGACIGACTVACSGHGAGAPPAPARAQTMTALDADTFAGLLAMADARRVDSVLLSRALTSGSTPVRVEAILAAGEVRAWTFVPRLRDVLRGSDTAAAASAAFALGLLRDSTSVSALGDALAQRGLTEPSVSSEAAWALGEIGESARAPIEKALSSTPPLPAPALASALYAAAALRPVPVELAAPLVEAPGADVARAAAYALSRSLVPEGARALLMLARSDDAVTRAYSARGLSKQAAGDSLAPQAIAALTPLATDANAHVRVPAVQSLSTYGAAGYSAVTAALTDPDENVRIAAAAVLDRVLAGRPRADWERAFAADTTLAYRANVLGSALRAGVTLTAMDHDNPDRWQRLGDWRYRAAVAQAATGTSVERLRDIALPLANDPDGRVRTAAYTAFAPAVDTVLPPNVHPWRRQFMRYALSDADFYVRATALNALRRTAAAGDVPSVLRSYALARADSQDDARVAAIAMLAAAWQHDSSHFTPEMRRAVAALPQATDPLEIANTRGVSLFSTWHDDAPPPHDAEWYRTVVDSVVVPALAGRAIRATIESARGPIVVELFGLDAPLTVANFVALAREGFYRGTTFHRVVPAFVAQDGDPRGDGNGGPPYTIRDELNRRRYLRGVLGMALSGPDTGGSQYFLTLTPQPHLDGHYTSFGRVVQGLDALDRVVEGDSIEDVLVE